MNGIQALGEAMSTLTEVNMDSQMSKAMEIVTLILATSTLSLDWSKGWEEDAKLYYIDSLKAVGDQSSSATAAADYAKYQEDLQQGQNEVGNQDNIGQSNKSVLKGLGNAMDQVYSTMQGPVQFMKALNKAILMMGS